MLHSHNNAGFDYLFWTMTLWRCLSKYQHLDSWRGRCHQRWVMEHEAMRIVCRYLKWVVLNPDGIMWNWNINMYTFFMLTDICQYLQPRYLLFIVLNKRWIYAQSCTVAHAQTCSQLDVGCSILSPSNSIVVPWSAFQRTKKANFLCWYYFSERKVSNR